MTPDRNRVLVLGFGNPGRGDDALGPLLAEEVARRRLPGVDADATYELQIEDAVAVAAHDRVFFVDATVEGDHPFRFERVRPEPGIDFSSHGIGPGGVVDLAERHFESNAECWLLTVRGDDFGEFQEGLSARARVHFEAALAALLERLDPQSAGANGG